MITRTTTFGRYVSLFMEKKTPTPPNGNSFRNDSSENPAKSRSILIQPLSILVPKGVRATKNMDEKFKVSPSDGTAAFSIPFPVTLGRNGFNPSIALSYNSGSGELRVWLIRLIPWGYTWLVEYSYYDKGNGTE